MTTTEEIRAWQAQERDRARAKLLAEGVSLSAADMLLSVAHEMHEAQAACAARLMGEAPHVALH